MTPNRAPVIVVVDDHTLMGEVLALTLRQRGYEAYYLSAIGITCDRITTVDPALVLLDIAFGDNSRGGLDLLKTLVKDVPLVAMLTGVDDRTVLAEAIAGGAAGIIGKHESIDEVISRVDVLLSQGSSITPADRDRAAVLVASKRAKQLSREERLSALTERERNVLEQVSAGASVTEIANNECVSLATVRTHVRAVLQKLDVHSQVAAVAFYLDRN